MKKIIFMGAIGCGKTSLCQSLQGEEVKYNKTQAVSFYPEMIDTPGEFILHRNYYHALIVTAADAKAIGLVQSITEQEQVYSPGFASTFPKPAIGIISKVDLAQSEEEIQFVEKALKNAGVKKIFRVSAYTGEGIKELLDYINNTDGKAEES